MTNSVRRDWVLAGITFAAGFIGGIATALFFAGAFDADLSAFIGTVVGVGVPVIAALHVIHYQRKVETEEQAKFIIEVAQELYKEAHVLHRLFNDYTAQKHPALLPKIGAQVPRLLEVIDIWERDVGKGAAGAFDLRRRVFIVSRTLATERAALTDTIMRDENIPAIGLAAGAIEEQVERNFGSELKPMPFAEYMERAWAVDHE